MKPWVAPDRIPYPFEFQLLEGGLGALLGADGERDPCGSPPAVRRAWREFYNGPESFTPDNQFIRAPAP